MSFLPGKYADEMRKESFVREEIFKRSKSNMRYFKVKICKQTLEIRPREWLKKNREEKSSRHWVYWRSIFVMKRKKVWFIQTLRLYWSVCLKGFTICFKYKFLLSFSSLFFHSQRLCFTMKKWLKLKCVVIGSEERLSFVFSTCVVHHTQGWFIDQCNNFFYFQISLSGDHWL